MTEWKDCRLGDILQFQRGFDLLAKDRHEGIIPVISSSGITGYHNKAKADRPGVIIGRKGTLGTVHYIDASYWPHDTTLWVKDFKENCPKFIYYFLKLMHLESYDVGASNPTLNRNHIHKLKLRFPPLLVQKKIAAVLSAYDDLIENNTRRIALLEKMAEEIYREWFVRLRFPGHEQTTFHKGIPEGWEISELRQIAHLTMGQSPKSEFYNIKGEGLPFNQGVGTYGSRFPRKEIFCSTKGRIAQKGDILLSVRAPVGRLNIADCTMVIGRGLAAIRHKQGLNSYLFYLLKNLFLNEDVIGNGAIFNSVCKTELESLKFLKPSDLMAKKYNRLAKDIDVQVQKLLASVEILQQTRDRLLTRLISGKLSLEDLDIQFPPSTTDPPSPAQGQA